MRIPLELVRDVLLGIVLQNNHNQALLSLTRCALVCRAFFKEARPLIFSTIEILDRWNQVSSDRARRLSLLERTFREQPTLARLVHTFVLRIWDAPRVKISHDDNSRKTYRNDQLYHQASLAYIISQLTSLRSFRAEGVPEGASICWPSLSPNIRRSIAFAIRSSHRTLDTLTLRSFELPPEIWVEMPFLSSVSMFGCPLSKASPSIVKGDIHAPFSYNGIGKGTYLAPIVDFQCHSSRDLQEYILGRYPDVLSNTTRALFTFSGDISPVEITSAINHFGNGLTALELGIHMTSFSRETGVAWDTLPSLGVLPPLTGLKTLKLRLTYRATGSQGPLPDLFASALLPLCEQFLQVGENIETIEISSLGECMALLRPHVDIEDALSHLDDMIRRRSLHRLRSVKVDVVRVCTGVTKGCDRCPHCRAPDRSVTYLGDPYHDIDIQLNHVVERQMVDLGWSFV